MHLLRTLVLASRNKKKLVEIKPLLAGLPIELVDVSVLPSVPEIEETGKTFLENAILKAVGVAKAAGEWTLAEDSGLVVPALGGEPGVDSAIYAGTHGDDVGNNRKLLEKIVKLPVEKRGAYFICTAVLADPDGNVVASTEGRCHGVIVTETRGVAGFGYDPLFLIQEYHQTFGELSGVVKGALSHRAKAITQLRPVLAKHI